MVPPPPQLGSRDSFVLSGLGDGDYFLRLSAGTKWTVESVVVGGLDYTNRPIAISGDVTGVAVMVTDKAARLSGTVRDDHRQAVTQGAVIAFATNDSLWSQFGFEPPWIKTSSVVRSGEYRISGLPKGDYFVVAVEVSQVDAWQNPGFFKGAASSATRVSLDWGTAKTLDLLLSHPADK